jgi:hypothetical protein
MRQFERFYSALGRFQVNAFSPNFSVFNANLNNILNHNGINIISCSKKILGRHINQSYGSAFLKNPTKNNNSAIIQTTQIHNIELSTEVYPNLINLDNLFYPYGDVSTSLLATPHVQVLSNLTVGTSQSMLLTHSTIYSLLIKLTMFNTFCRS